MEIKTIVNYLETALKAKLPLLMVGKPATAKTSLWHLAADNLGMKKILFHPAVADPTDIKGMPGLGTDRDGKTYASFFAFDNLLALINATEPTVVIFDDIGQAPFSVQAGLMPVISDRIVCGQKVSDHVVFAGATNSREDGAGVQGILEPLKTRFAALINVEPDADALAKHLMMQDAPAEIVAFLRTHPQECHRMPEKLKGMDMWPNYRTWDFLSRWMQAGIRDLEFWSGVIGKPCATQFWAFCEMANKMPDIDSILKGANPPLPNDLGIIHTACVAMVRKVSDKTLGNAIKWLEQSDRRWTVMFMREASEVKPALLNSRTFTEWLVKNQDVFKSM